VGFTAGITHPELPRKISAVSIAVIGLHPKFPENFSKIDRKNILSVCPDIIGL